jgi:Cytochrome c554 and c-prime/Tetratricopeptide repeat
MGWSPLERGIRITAVLALCSAAGGTDSFTSTQSPHPTPVREADEICSRCHQDIFRNYLSTPMANASGLASDRVFTGGFHHAPSGVDYRVSNQDGSLRLNYSRRGDTGLEGSRKLDYFLGSGHLGITYLYTINGYLLESPVAFYAQSQAYDMKPGLADFRIMPSALPMTRACMRCHMSGVQREDPGTRNHFQGLPFLHGGVTCESCHGDTTAHLTSSGRAPAVNPLKLDPERRDSVCISCHLEGDSRIEHAGREADEYRPGERIADYVSYFVYASDNMVSRAVSEIEELSLSKCKRVSGDRMSCMNCHDPHYSPPADQRAAFYRSKCLACHTAAEYSKSHFKNNPDCTSCHMPKGKVPKVPHTAWTDHRIRQNPDPFETFEPSQADRELVAFLPGNTSQRDMALAYYDLAGNASQAERAWTQLLQAKKSDPQDPPVLTALAYLADARGDRTLAIELYREALKIDPVDITATNNLAILLAKSGQLTAAEALWQKTFDLNEDIDEPGINLALVECMLGNKNAAQRVFERVLLYSPDQTLARRKLEAIQSGEETCAPPSLR